MAVRSPVTASEEQKAALETLAASKDRGEADRARAILLTLKGWTSARIAEVFCVREDTVRFWRGEFARGGVDAVKASGLCRPAAGEDRGSVAGLHAVARSARRRQAKLDDPTSHRRDQTGGAHRDRAIPALQGLAKKNFRWRRPRHTSCWKHASGVTKRRQTAAEIERVGLRLQRRKAQAEAGDIVLLYGD